MNRLRPVAPWFALALVVLWTSALRVRLIAAGPDPDIDAYLHFVIGMRLASEPVDLTVHWVWLPLWHFLCAAVYALGGGVAALRYASVALTAASSFALAWLLRRHLAALPAAPPWLAGAERALPFAAGAAFALWPLNLRGGASAEPEALFQLLVVALALAWQSRRPVAAGLALAAAAMLRYEAWPVLAAVAALWARERRTARDALAWALPAAAVALWCVAHRAATGEWLRFMRDNRAYVEDAWRGFRLAERDLPRVRLAPVWYAAALPAEMLRQWAILLAPGAVWMARRGPRGLSLPSLALLATVTAVWVARRNLGLERHFAALVPAYATMAAAGLVTAAAWAGSRVGPRGARAAVAAALALSLVGFARWRVASAERSYRRDAREGYAGEQRAAEILRREALPDATVFSQSAPVKALAGLPLTRYVDWNPADLRDLNLLVESVHHGEAWVAAAPAQVTSLREVVVRHQSASVVLLQRRAPPGFDRALLQLRPCR